MGGISTSKWPHSSCASRVPIRRVWGLPAGSGPSTCPTVVDPVGFVRCGWWKRTGPVVGVVRGALLGPETTGPVPFGGGGGVVSQVPGVLPVVVSPSGVLPPVCRVCGLLFENCIVDASILRTGAAGSRASLPSRGVCLVGCGAVFVIDRRDTAAVPRWGVVVVVSVCSVIMWQVFKGARWMPWHQEPMKDAVICDKPRGADKRAVIRGSPNGETPPRVMRGDPHLNS